MWSFQQIGAYAFSERESVRERERVRSRVVINIGMFFGLPPIVNAI